MEEQELQVSEKVVQEITRNGLVEKHLASGSIDRISDRIIEQQFREQQEELQLGRHEELQKSSWKNTRKQHTQQTAGSELVREYQKDSQKQSDGQNAKERKRSETLSKSVPLRADKNSSRLREHSEASQHQERLHHKESNKLNPDKSVTEKGNGQEKSSKQSRSAADQQRSGSWQRETIRQREFRKIKQKGERKVFEHEDDNLSLEASHSTYRSLRKRWKHLRRAYYRSQNKIGERDTGGGTGVKKKQGQRLKNTSSRLQAFNKQHNGQDSKNLDRKKAQKKLYQKRYAQKVRESAENKEIFQKNQNAQAGAEVLKQFFAKQKYIVIAIVLMIVCFILLIAVIVSIGIAMFTAGTNYTKGIIQTDYNNLTDIESYFKQAEAELEYRIAHMEEEFPDYDEYSYELGEIGHDSVILISYFGAKYGDFTFPQIQNELIEIFNSMYDLQLDEEIEIRYRMEKVYNPLTGKYEDKQVAYEHKILNVTLTVTDLKSILEPRLETDEQRNQWQIYQDSYGNQQVYGNPLEMDWHQHISSQFGYRTHPISGDLKFHSGVDIAASAGTDIHSCMSGIVISAGWSNSYGYNVVIQNANGYRTKYAHCSVLHVSAGENVKMGDIIAEVGSTGNSTGNHLHLECIAADGTYLNPIYMVSNFAGGK